MFAVICTSTFILSRYVMHSAFYVQLRARFNRDSDMSVFSRDTCVALLRRVSMHADMLQADKFRINLMWCFSSYVVAIYMMYNV